MQRTDIAPPVPLVRHNSSPAHIRASPAQIRARAAAAADPVTRFGAPLVQ
jgi:hypothetical protein